MGIFDTLFAQDARGEQLRGGLLGMGVGLMEGANNPGGRFAPAMARGFARSEQGMQDGQRNYTMQAEAQRKQQMQQMQMNVAKRLQGLGRSTGSNAIGDAGQAGGGAQAPGLSLNDYQVMAALGMPGTKELFDMYKFGQQGIKLDAGATYKDPATGEERYMPKMDNGIISQNGRAMAMPGYADANAKIQGAATTATEGAKYPYSLQEKRDAAGLDPIKVIGADGNEYFDSRLNVAVGGGAERPMAGRNPVVQGSAIELNNNFIKSDYQPTIDAGGAAREMLSNIEALRSIDLKTGWGTEAKAGAANFLAGMGVAPESAREYASNAQRFQSVALAQVNKVLNAAKGPQTEGDSQRAQKTFVSLRNTPQANAFIVDYAQAVANQQARKASYYQRMQPYAQKEGDLTKIGREWSKLQGSIWDDPVLQSYKGGR